MELELLSLAYPPLLIFAAALLVLVLPRIAGFTVGALSLAAVLAISLIAPEGQHLAGTFLGFEVVPYYIDDFSRMVGLGLGFLGVCSVIYAYSSEASKTLVAFALVYVASSVGAAFAGDWLVLLFMWELMAVTSTLVVWHYGGDAVRAGFRYALFHGTGGVLVMLAVAAHYVQTGTFIYDGTGIADGIPALLAVLGMGVNVAFIGVHTWLPDTYPRPHIAASVFLSVYTTKTSAFVLYRAFPIGAESDLGIYIAYMGGLMSVYGATFALLQHDMRALLSYHIQAQLGYIVAGIGMGAWMIESEIAVAGAMSHLFNNILFKSLLFMAVGVVIYRTGEEDLYELGGLWREMPLTAIGFGLGALSITAIPGFNGYVSKGMLFDAADPHYYGIEASEPLYWLLWLGAIGTLLSFIKLGYYVFFHGESDVSVPDAKPGQTVAMLGLGAACVLFGVWWEGLADLAPTLHAHGGGEFTFAYPNDGEGHMHPYSTSHLQTAGVLTAVAAITFVVVRKPLSKLDLGDPAMIVYPITYHVSRWTMLAVTEIYAAVDRVVVGGVKRCYWIGNNPVLAVNAAARRLPLVDVEERQPTDGGRPSTIHLRTSIGTTVLLLTLVLTVVLWLLVV
ncbi:monovalent cation/H+ antiporter subunit D [Natrinema pellirubrum DSM 15624]|uniref:Formate hydrogenlyase subunit 3/multisubunit Na+/H+ antiporter, MnhD subunit n=1 Tax=Natrinema pellirubrum (strain DSM 15624 / CIP 106293 / JCM 10476 / NCIMB 786 / 157) TaxID=797303 RepID=L0JLM6_NATP1|nr:Na(+)/H(+) antiporter subunit D [Natrinema pellirubrum]AGB31256.1 formate hydrogenlyase subunit 3/multisubunit Na+/H+ antiporter, MnhD subunit [Natrinema pellirubrum DSM 15624]ELY81808.1 monovalent cation/H+ antiporter subunit D [Natrinema pellirubrum DSM 15624]